MFRTRVDGQRGYGLPATLLMIIVFALMGLVGLSMARQELRTQAVTTAREVAFYSAEMGLARGVENWSRPYGLIPPGTSWELDRGDLPGGAAYRVAATKLNDGTVHSLFAIRAEGRAKDGTTQQTGLLVATLPLTNPFRAALTVTDSASLRGTTDVIGFDHIPGTWNGPYCSSLDDAMPGLRMADTLRYERRGAARLEGDPRLVQDSDTAGYYSLGDMTFEELADNADITLPGGTDLDADQPRPSYNGDGTCDTSDPFNWGDPLNASGACADWFPTIYIEGDALLDGNMSGQGLLLVDGDLRAAGGFEFYGPVFVKGDLISVGGFRFYGGVKAEAADLGAGNSEVLYSACVLQRVLSNTQAARPRPLTERPWFAKR